MTRSSLRPALAASASALMRLRRLSGASRTSASMAHTTSGSADCRNAAKRVCASFMKKAYAETRGDGIGFSTHVGRAAGDYRILIARHMGSESRVRSGRIEDYDGLPSK